VCVRLQAGQVISLYCGICIYACMCVRVYVCVCVCVCVYTLSAGRAGNFSLLRWPRSIPQGAFDRQKQIQQKKSQYMREIKERKVYIRNQEKQMKYIRQRKVNEGIREKKKKRTK